jgi:hypothetical protein
MNDWKTNWDHFKNRVQEHVKIGATAEALSEWMAGNQVNWAGRLSKVDLDPQSPLIVMEMEDGIVEFRDGRRGVFPHLVVPINDSELAEWKDAVPNTHVRFAASFVAEDHFLPPFGITILGSGRTVISLRLVDAQYLGQA